MTDREKLNKVCDAMEKMRDAIGSIQGTMVSNWKPGEELVMNVLEELHDAPLWKALADERKEAAG